jgi:hypothetical protein
MLNPLGKARHEEILPRQPRAHQLQDPLGHFLDIWKSEMCGLAFQAEVLVADPSLKGT